MLRAPGRADRGARSELIFAGRQTYCAADCHKDPTSLPPTRRGRRGDLLSDPHGGVGHHPKTVTTAGTANPRHPAQERAVAGGHHHTSFGMKNWFRKTRGRERVDFTVPGSATAHKKCRFANVMAPACILAPLSGKVESAKTGRWPSSSPGWGGARDPVSTLHSIATLRAHFAASRDRAE